MIECTEIFITALGYKACVIYYLLEWDTQHISAIACSQWPAPTCGHGYSFIMENPEHECTLLTLKYLITLKIGGQLKKKNSKLKLNPSLFGYSFLFLWYTFSLCHLFDCCCRQIGPYRLLSHETII